MASTAPCETLSQERTAHQELRTLALCQDSEGLPIEHDDMYTIEFRISKLQITYSKCDGRTLNYIKQAF